MATRTIAPHLDRLMTATQKAMRSRKKIDADAPLRVGVDLGTAYTVVVVTDPSGKPLSGAYQFADVVRDGIVWDFAGAQRSSHRSRRPSSGASGAH